MVTTSLIVIIWLIVNGIGVIASLWLAHISRERKVSTINEQFSITPKKPRLRNANRQIRDRLARAICQIIFVVLGTLDMFGIKLPYDGVIWLFLVAATV